MYDRIGTSKDQTSLGKTSAASARKKMLPKPFRYANVLIAATGFALLVVAALG